MKTKFIIVSLLCVITTALYAQSWQSGTNKLYSYPTSTTNVGIGTSSPQYKLDVNGALYLRTAGTRWNYSFLYWQYHSLVMGTPPGTFSHNTVELKPGGANNQTETLYSRLEFYNTTGIGEHTKTIDLHSGSQCWFNTGGNFGIGTTSPAYTLDVNGTIRAKKVIVNLTSGADFVFDKEYNLRTLNEVENYIKENKHLPEIQSESEMIDEGVELQNLTIQLLQKVEELTLYTIEQEKRIAEQEKRIRQLEQIK